MMVTEAELSAWTNASGRNWDQLCQALMWNYCNQFGSVVSTPPSAIAAYYDSELISSDVWSAPPGAFIYMDLGAYGHVSTRVDAGGDAMASGLVLIEWGINAGRTDLADYLARTGAQPLGWAWDNAGNTYPFDPAGGATEMEAPEMYLFRETNGTVWLMTSNGRAGITDPAHVDLFVRMFRAYPGYDTFNAAELDIVTSYIREAAAG